MMCIWEELLQQRQFLSERSNGRKKGFHLRAAAIQTRLRKNVWTEEKIYLALKSSLMNDIWSVSWKQKRTATASPRLTSSTGLPVRGRSQQMPGRRLARRPTSTRRRARG